MSAACLKTIISPMLTMIVFVICYELSLLCGIQKWFTHSHTENFIIIIPELQSNADIKKNGWINGKYLK